MPQPASIANHLPPGNDVLQKQITDLQTQIKQNAASRSLQNSSIGPGGVTVNPGGTGLTIETGDSPYFPGDQVGQIRFHSRFGNDEATIISPEDNSGAPMFIGLFSGKDAAGGQGDIIIEDTLVVLDCSDGTNEAQAWITVGAGSPDGVASFHAIDTEIYHNRVSINGRGWTMDAGSGELRAQTDTLGTHIPIRATAFNVASSVMFKTDIAKTSWNALSVVKGAPAFQWRYRAEHSTDTSLHVGPMAEDLPAELVRDNAVDLRDLIGILWGAVQELTARVEALEASHASG